MQTSYFVYVKDFIASLEDPNMRFVISYRLSSVSNFIETKLNSLIEVPYYDEDEFPGIFFEIIVIYAKNENNLKEAGVTVNDTRKVIVLETVSDEATEQEEEQDDQYSVKFKLVIELKAFVSVPKEMEVKEKILVFGVDLIEKKEFQSFLKSRQATLEQNNILRAASWKARYKLDLAIQKQNYSIYLEDDDPMTIYFFFLPEGETNSTLTLKLKELVIEDLSFGGSKKKNKLTQDSQLGETMTISISELLQKEDQQCFHLPFDMVFDLKLTLKLTVLKNNEFLEKFVGYTSVKVLETRLFDTELKPQQLLVQLKSLDPDALEQKQVLQPFGTLPKSTFVVNAWDFQHNLVLQKLSTQQKQQGTTTAQEDDQPKSYDSKKLFSNAAKIQFLDESCYTQEFTDIIQYYEHIHKYERILEQWGVVRGVNNQR